MKITFITGGLGGGGAERVLCNLMNYSVVSGNDITVICSGSTDNSYHIEKNIKVVSLEGKRRIKLSPLRVLVKMKRLKKLVKESDADLFVAFLPSTIKALFHYRKYIKVPIIVTESSTPQKYGKKKQKYLLKCFSKSSGAVFLTDDAQKFYNDRINLKSSIVIPNAVNKEFIKPLYEGERRKVIVGVGRHVESKNFELLIDAFYEVQKTLSDYALEIYGKGPLTESYKERCKQLGIENKVSFLGFCDNIEDKIYGASLFVLPSNVEGIPVSLIEAMALSTPSISTDFEGGGARVLILDGENGILVPVGNKDLIVSAMIKVLSSEKIKQDFAVNGRKIIDDYSPDVIYPKWEKYFKEIIGNEI